MLDHEYEAADEIRRLLQNDRRFNAVSGATAFRHANAKEGWQDAGFFSFERNGKLYFVTVERADAQADHEFRPAQHSGEDMCTYSWRVESERTYCQRPASEHPS